MAKEDWKDYGPFVECYPITTKDVQMGYFFFGAYEWPPQNAPIWDPDSPGDTGGLGVGEKVVNAWYLADFNGNNLSDLLAWYYPITGEDVEYFDDWRAWDTENSRRVSGPEPRPYDVGVCFITYDMAGMPPGPYSSASFVSRMSAISLNEGSRLHGHLLPLTTYQDHLWNWAVSWTHRPSGGSFTPQLLSDIGNGLNSPLLDPYEPMFFFPLRMEFPFHSLPSTLGQLHLRLAISIADADGPTDFNGLSILHGYNGYEALTGDETEAEIIQILLDFPALRFYRGGEISVSPELSMNLSFDIDATIVAEDLFHPARRRRNYLRS